MVVVYIVGIAVSALVALLVAYQHRRQMRQVELFRQDPSVGVNPPPGWFTKHRWNILMTLSITVNVILFFAGGNRPITRLDVISIATGVGGIVFVLLSRSIDRLLGLFGGVTDILRGLTRLASEERDRP